MMANYIKTISGDNFYFESPESYDYTIDVLAHSQSMLCRFTGQCKAFYSVAQHAILVSHLVPKELALQALLHDAQESFLGDLSSPLKRELEGNRYQDLEKRVQQAIFTQYGVPAIQDIRVDHADRQALKFESYHLLNHGDTFEDWFPDIPLLSGNIEPMSPLESRMAYIQRYNEIRGWGFGY